MNKIEDVITEYRNRIIEGEIVDLSPITEKELLDIVRLRNTPKMMYFLHQDYALTLEMQKSWYDKYLERKDDIYWVIKDKQGNVIGTNRLYDIKEDKCVQGSLMIDEKYSMGAPFTAEGMMLSIDFAFDNIGVKTIVNEDRHDNKNMNSISKHFGFEFLHESDIRGVKYMYYELYKENYKREQIEEIINLWLNR